MRKQSLAQMGVVLAWIVLLRITPFETQIKRKDNWIEIFLVTLQFFLVLFFCLFRAAPVAHGGSQARGQIGAVATGLHHSHSNTRAKPHLQPTTAHSNTGSLTH